MPDSKIEENPRSPDSVSRDAESLPGVTGVVHRERFRLAGDSLTQVAEVLNVEPGVGDHGLVVRVVPGSGSGLTDAQLRATPVPIGIKDGGNTAAVKPASTAAVAADPALVVTISPNTAPITAADASVAATGAAAPGFTQQNGGTDGANIQANRMFDLDTGAGTQYNLGVSLRKAAAGGSVEAGTAADPLRIDPTGTTTQPVSATALPLPAGAATSALQTQPGVDIGDVTVNNAAGAAAVNIQDGGNSITVDGPLTNAELRAAAVPVSTAQLPAALVGGRLDGNVGAWFGSTTPTVGQKTGAASVPAVLASDVELPLERASSASADGTVTQGVASQQLFAANTARIGLLIRNDAVDTMYIHFGAAASLANSPIAVGAQQTYEMPKRYSTSSIHVIWSVAGSGSAIGQELT